MAHATQTKLESESELDWEIERYWASELEVSWKEAPPDWGHSLHSLAPFVGGFPPELAYFFINQLTDVSDTVLDPFCGGGTVPLEAAIHNREALGCDLFAYAHVLSRAKCNPLSTAEFRECLHAALEEAENVEDSVEQLLENEDLEVFYSNYTLEQLLKLRKVIADRDTAAAHYLQAIICGILHGPSDIFLSLQTKDTYSGTADYVERYAERNDLTCPERDIRPRAIRKHEMVQADYIPPWIGDRTEIRCSDARDLPFDDSTADLILTSPPYMAKLDYTWNNWLRLWWLNEDRKAEQSKLVMTQAEERYKTFMRESLHQMDSALGQEGIAVLVVGDITKKLADGPQTINTARLIERLAAEETGLEPHSVILDDYGIDNRSFVAFNQVKYDYENKRRDELAELDRCLILTKGAPNVDLSNPIDWSCEPYASEKST